jgi:glycosyltransferase involved in cell wall biosynthesis
MNSDGELLSDVKTEISRLNLDDNVSFITGLSNWIELGEIYRKCDVLFLPAKFSNGNFTIIEAMASGMGIVISDQVLGVGNMIIDDVNGYRTNNSVEELASRLIKYIDCPSLISEHAEKNREIVSELGPAGTAKLFKTIFELHLVE